MENKRHTIKSCGNEGYDDRKKMKLSRKVLLPRSEEPAQKPRNEGNVNP
ncbi:hypothetical protein LNP04_04770 [Chryseobacterium sp. C-71]|nr:hypothetical protein [Chryseobacterium sp. C-71]UFH33037.1 hypothetical protein LNP04_04770 [Chryseobacterium sp. C-71]